MPDNELTLDKMLAVMEELESHRPDEVKLYQHCAIM